MGFGIFIHRSDSIYADIPAERYQFPRQYLSRVTACIGSWIIYYEPSKVLKPKGYYATAKIRQIIDDPNDNGMHYAIVEPGSYLDFQQPVPFNGPLGIVEKSVLNLSGQISGRAQAAVRVIPADDYRRITELGLGAGDFLLPRTGETSEFGVEAAVPHTPAGLYAGGFGSQDQAPFLAAQDRVRIDYSRPFRDRIFRRIVLQAYDQRCAVTGLKLINGGGRAEVEAAHIKSVEANGPDMVSNGIALSGTAHWMFDRGLISLTDDLTILISRQVNDVDSIAGLLNRSGKALWPSRPSDRPHPSFLQWHRETCFKH
jgi:putative restriction endonuclease